jgi:hypothetical protein
MIAAGTPVTGRPLQIHPCGFPAYSTDLGCLMAKRPLAIRDPAPGTRLPGSAPGTCSAGPRFPRPPPLAPPAPQPVARPCSSASSLLWRGPTSRAHTSPATAPHLPGLDRQHALAVGRTRDLPVPAQGASAHAGVSDHAQFKRALALTRPFVLLSALRTASAPGITVLSRLNGWPVAPLPTLHLRPYG